jgi:anti-sigma B factor antagonist
MEIEVQQNGRVAVTRVLNRRLDASQADEFREFFSKRIAAGNRLFTLDLSEVHFMDSTGLGAIVFVVNTLGQDGELAVCSPQETVMRVFKVTRADKMFQIFNHLEDAIQALLRAWPPEA